MSHAVDSCMQQHLLKVHPIDENPTYMHVIHNILDVRNLLLLFVCHQLEEAT
jgi:hypothetical protein